MDYAGQHLGENIYYFLTIFFGAIAWIVGCVNEDFYMTFWGWLVGLVLSLIICIPDWPIFNRKPVTWLDKIDHTNTSTPSGSNTAAATKNATASTGISKPKAAKKQESAEKTD